MGNGTELGRVRGLGSAHHGAHDWLLMRYTSAGALVLWAFLIVSFVLLPDLSYATVSEWAGKPLIAVILALLVIVTLWHAKMGVAEIIGDYVHETGNKFASMLALTLATYAGIAFGLFCIARLAFAQGAS